MTAQDDRYECASCEILQMDKDCMLEVLGEFAAFDGSWNLWATLIEQRDEERKRADAAVARVAFLEAKLELRDRALARLTRVTEVGS